MKNRKTIKSNRDNKKLRRRRLFKEVKRRKNKINNSLSDVDKKRRKLIIEQRRRLLYEVFNEKGYTFIYAPEILSFIKEPTLVIEFINKLKRAFNEQEKVFVDLSNVKDIGHDAIVILLSIMIRFKSRKIKFNGNFPKLRKARNFLIDSKFFEYLSENFDASNNYEIGDKNSIHTHGNLIVDSELAGEILLNASKTILDKPIYAKGAFRVLQEIMHNTVSHAKGKNEIEAKHWWLSVEHDKSEKVVKFSFVDFGVGVFESLINTPKTSKWAKGLDHFRNFVNLDKNDTFFQEIIEGKIHASVTGHHYRGKGIPGVNQVFKRNQINNLFILTNNVFYDGEKADIQKLSTRFDGTFYYFELNEQCYEN